MTSRPGPPTIGHSVLALIMVLIAVLGWMLAGSVLLVNTVEGHHPDMPTVWFSIPLGAGYLLLAWTIVRQQGWGLVLACLLLVTLLFLGIADLERPGRMALGTTLTLVMAAVATMAAIVALSFPRLDRVIEGKEGSGDDPRSG